MTRCGSRSRTSATSCFQIINRDDEGEEGRQRAAFFALTAFLAAFFTVLVAFFAAFLVDFFVDFLLAAFFAPVVVPRLSTAMSFVPIGVPRPVQGSQPGPALKPSGEPV